METATAAPATEVNLFDLNKYKWLDSFLLKNGDAIVVYKVKEKGLVKAGDIAFSSEDGIARFYDVTFATTSMTAIYIPGEFTLYLTPKIITDPERLASLDAALPAEIKARRNKDI